MTKLLFILLCMVMGCTSTSKQSSPFKGEWKQETAEEFNLLKVDLQEKSVKLPDGSGSCFGYLQTENEFAADYWIIDEVTNIEGNAAEVKVYSWRYGTPDDKQMRTLAYNADQQTVSWKQDGHEFTLSPSDGSSNEEIQAENKPVKEKKSISFWDKVLAIIGVILMIAVIIGIYYLFKIVLFYAAITILFGLILGIISFIIAGLISWEHAPKIAFICACVGGVIGLGFGICSTLDIIKTPFASGIASDLAKADFSVKDNEEDKYTYELSDKYGNPKKLKNTGASCISEENYYEDKDGNRYSQKWGSNEVKRE